jgi:hypothetical protein
MVILAGYAGYAGYAGCLFWLCCLDGTLAMLNGVLCFLASYDGYALLASMMPRWLCWLSWLTGYAGYALWLVILCGYAVYANWKFWQCCLVWLATLSGHA